MEALGEASSHGITSKRLTLLGERSGACDAVERAIIAVLLIVVLTGLGGASQERSAARIFLSLNLVNPANPDNPVSIALAQQARWIGLSREVIQVKPQHPTSIRKRHSLLLCTPVSEQQPADQST